MPGQAADPETFCAMINEKSDQIESIACVISWKPNEKGERITNVAYTSMTFGHGAWMEYVFRKTFMQQLEDHS
jgi:hypothetical protein